MPERDNYVTPENLLARIAIHGYATNPGWTQWLFERETPHERGSARILDVGSGTGVLWASNQDKIDPDWVLTLADSSHGMTHASHEALGARAKYVVADIQDLPFADDSFDLVLANHMLYHVHDRPRAFREITRVLRSAGSFHCSTNGRGHLAELGALQHESVKIAELTEEFGLETGPPQLTPYFMDIEVQRFDNSLKVPSAGPVLAYIRSGERYDQGTDLSAVQAVVEAEIRRTGVFSITTRPGLISSRNRKSAELRA